MGERAMPRWLGRFFRLLTAVIGLLSLGFLLWFVLVENPGVLAVIPDEQGLSSPTEIAIAISRSVAIVLIPFGLIYAAVRPALWKAALIPFVWAIVATILVDPDVLLYAADWFMNHLRQNGQS